MNRQHCRPFSISDRLPFARRDESICSEIHRPGKSSALRKKGWIVCYLPYLTDSGVCPSQEGMNHYVQGGVYKPNESALRKKGWIIIAIRVALCLYVCLSQEGMNRNAVICLDKFWGLPFVGRDESMWDASMGLWQKSALRKKGWIVGLWLVRVWELVCPSSEGINPAT